MIIDFDGNDPNKKIASNKYYYSSLDPSTANKKNIEIKGKKRKEEKEESQKKGDRRSGPDPITLWSTFFRIFRSLFLSFIEFRDEGRLP